MLQIVADLKLYLSTTTYFMASISLSIMYKAWGSSHFSNLFHVLIYILVLDICKIFISCKIILKMIPIELISSVGLVHIQTRRRFTKDYLCLKILKTDVVSFSVTQWLIGTKIFANKTWEFMFCHNNLRVYTIQ